MRVIGKFGRRLLTVVLGAAMAISAVFVAAPDNKTEAAVAFDSQAEGTWKKSSKGWWYQNADGTYPADEWKKIGGKWYYFNEAGYMENDCYRDNYYINNDGAMVGKEMVGWKKNTDGWRFFLEDEETTLKNTWFMIDGEWYYFNTLGIMETGWIKYQGEWYYCVRTGEMVTGTKVIHGIKYVFDKNGVLVNEIPSNQ